MRFPIQNAAVRREPQAWSLIVAIEAGSLIRPLKSSPTDGHGSPKVTKICDETSAGSHEMTCGSACCDWTTQYCLNGQCMNYGNGDKPAQPTDSFCFNHGGASVCLLNHA